MSESSAGKILFIVKSEKTPSSRIRALDLLPGLRSAGLECEIEYLPKSFFARRRLFKKCRGFDVVVFQKRLLSFFEFRALRGNAKKLVFDFDDAVYMHNASPSSDPIDYISGTRSRRFKRIVRAVDLVVAANPVLAEMANFAGKGGAVEIIPSSVPVSNYTPKGDYALSDPPVIGWVGTSVTMRYLEILAPALRELREKHPFVLRVVSNAEFAHEGIEVDNVRWTLDTESREIRGFDIGVMPLSDDPFSEGKSSYKLLQYMAGGVPSVASAVGMNVDVAEGGRCALLAESPAEFATRVGELLENRELRESMGRAAREKVETEFDRGVVATRLATILKKLLLLLLIAFLATTSFSTLSGESPIAIASVKKIPSASELAQLVCDLGDDKFAIREAATNQLISHGFYARGVIEGEMNSKDPEVRKRVKRIWKRIQWALFPEAGVDIKEFRLKFDSGLLRVSEREWEKFISEYGLNTLLLIQLVKSKPKTLIYAKTGMLVLMARCKPKDIAKYISASSQKKGLKELLGESRCKSLTVETINKLVHTMSLLEMNFEIVDLTASRGHLSKRMEISQLGVELLDNLKTAELIYDQALSQFNSSSSSKPDTDWKLVFYVVEAGKRGYLHLLK